MDGKHLQLIEELGLLHIPDNVSATFSSTEASISDTARIKLQNAMSSL